MRGRQGYVYFIQAGEYVKIGWSTDVPKRLCALQTSNALELKLINAIPCGLGMEGRLHRTFAEFHVRGEWFRASDEILDFATAGLPLPPVRKPFDPNDPDVIMRRTERAKELSETLGGRVSPEAIVRIMTSGGTIDSVICLAMDAGS